MNGDVDNIRIEFYDYYITVFMNAKYVYWSKHYIRNLLNIELMNGRNTLVLLDQ